MTPPKVRTNNEYELLEKLNAFPMSSNATVHGMSSMYATIRSFEGFFAPFFLFLHVRTVEPLYRGHLSQINRLFKACTLHYTEVFITKRFEWPEVYLTNDEFHLNPI